MGVIIPTYLRVQVPSQVNHNEQSEAQLNEDVREWERGVVRKMRGYEQELERRHYQAGLNSLDDHTLLTPVMTVAV
jgi:hypothetical protein